MSTTSENNKRIAKNTLMLYFRMIFLMLVSLYTSRVVLNALGVEDYGIYNVVGGVVAMFSLISNSLSISISRFLTFELGRGDLDKLKRVFSTSVSIQFGISILFILLAETIGLWFLNTQMNIPEDRMWAANWVLHFSVITFVINLISIPYNASIIAHERMSAFAYISILEAVFKLLIAYLITISPIDKLIYYALLHVLTALIIRLIYGIYCKRRFVECTYHFILDKPLLKEMTSFAGWGFLGSTAYLLNTQGVNILMNLFFGVAVNAARGVAVQVNVAVCQFINNFTTAVNPQITKSYAVGDFQYLHKLIFRSAKFSSFLMFIFAIPLVMEAQTVLDIWLKNPPEYAAVFMQLTLLGTFVDNALANCLVVSMQATGRIKKYQITVASCGVGVFLFSWLAFLLGCPPESAYIIWFIIYSLLLYIRLFILKDMLKMSPSTYTREVIFRVLPVLLFSVILPLVVHLLMPSGFIRLVCVCAVGIPATLAASYYIGMTTNEKKFIQEKVLSKVVSKFKK